MGCLHAVRLQAALHGPRKRRTLLRLENLPAPRYLDGALEPETQAITGAPGLLIADGAEPEDLIAFRLEEPYCGLRQLAGGNLTVDITLRDGSYLGLCLPTV